MRLTWVLQGKVCEHHVGGVGQRLRGGEGAIGNTAGLGADVGQQHPNIQVPAYIGRIAVKAGDDRWQVHEWRDEGWSLLTPTPQVEPGVEVDVQRALHQLSGGAEHGSNAQGERVDRRRQHEDARAEHGHVTGE